MRIVNFSNWSIRSRIIGAFVVLGLVVVSSALYTRAQLISANSNIDRAFHNEVPSAIGVLQIASATRSISMDVRGFLASGDARLRDQAFKSWAHLEAMLDAEKARAAKTGDRALAGKLDELSGLLARLKKTHTEIAAVAFTPAAFPATQKFESEIVPRVEKLLQVMAMMVEVEFQQPASAERRHVLKAASDMQAQFATVASHLRSYIDSGSEDEKSRFWTSWIGSAVRYPLVVG
ncbi:MAG: hypothetical protein K2Q28_14240 [Hyphomicrobium sp.]|nr:hypothetical protein [Hyphomicrobium sp.]